MIIDDEYVCQFMSRYGDGSLFDTFETIIKSICTICEYETTQLNVISRRLNTVKREVDKLGTVYKIVK